MKFQQKKTVFNETNEENEENDEKEENEVSPVLCYFVPFHTAVQGMFQESGERKSLGTF